MAAPHANHVFAATLVDQLAACGVRDACVSPGSRSAPVAIALARQGAIRVHVHVDERSGSFFGLGIAKATGRPVVLLCTSGTAAAEFHPAVVEAHQSQTPLIVLTADRPPELLDVGANQAIDQARLYGSAVRWFHDPGTPEFGTPARWRRLAVRAVAGALGPPAGPVHLNLPFREPLAPAPGVAVAPAGESTETVRPARHWDAAPYQPIHRALETARRPLVVAGEMRDGGRLAEFADMCSVAGVPVLAEPTSQLRLPGTIAGYDALLREQEWGRQHLPDLVLRLGAAPTSKALNQWLAGTGARIILADPEGLWRDPDATASDVARQDPFQLLAHLAQECSPEPGWAEAWLAADAAVEAAVERALAAGPLHEGQVVRALAAALPARAWLFAGSSMAIRDVDTFWPAAAAGRRVLGNRGASGIDGLVSTGLGVAAAAGEPTAILLGDLSLYHDMNGLWAARKPGVAAAVVVLDNAGGGIFEFLPPAEHADVFEQVFATPLGIDLAGAARLYGIDCRVVTEASGLADALEWAIPQATRPETRMVIVRFERSASVAGHRAVWAEVAAALRP